MEIPPLHVFTAAPIPENVILNANLPVSFLVSGGNFIRRYSNILSDFLVFFFPTFLRALEGFLV